MDLGNVPINIYIDLSQTFYSFDHSILLDKLTYYGICGVENLIFHTYLSNRHQYVEYNASKSGKKIYFNRRAPRFYLGTFTFPYIPALPGVSRVFRMLMYADDRTLYCKLNDANRDIILNNELCKISDCLSSNKLSLNVKI